jgi:SDR family mycofactocin-dependent oxidoreductase
LKLAAEGADLIILDRCEDLKTVGYPMGTEDELKETAAGIEAQGRRVVSAKVDVRDFDKLNEFVAEAVSELGGLDIVCANAGIASFGNVVDLSTDAWGEMISVNLTGAFNTAKATVPHILAQGRGGSVIFTSSTLGLEAVGGLSHYTASKHGVVGLMKTLALELGEHGIRSNAICPTNVDTDMFQNDGTYRLFFPDVENPGRADMDAENSVARQMHAIPIPNIEAQDISNAVMYLASEDARYVTGTTLVVDAGRLL